MGYTHYWHDSKKLTPTFVRAAKQVIDASPVPLASDPDDSKSKPEVSKDQIFLNGVGDDGYETFVFSAGEDFSFCKTAHKPYDVIVTALLSLVAHFGLAEVTSDGTPSEWEAGVQLAREATGLDVQCPVEER